jgi:hypothetical protein
MPGSEAEGARLLDAYLSAQRERDERAARLAGAWEPPLVCRRDDS